MQLIFEGHACFRMIGDQTEIIVDPYITDNPQCGKALSAFHPHLILPTHGHGDHIGDALELAQASGATLAERLCPQEQCPACTIHREAEESYAGLLASCLNDERLYLAYAEGDGLCLPHLAMALEQVPDPKALERLVQPQLARYRAMLSDLSEYIRKCDHRFRSEPFGSEGDVWLRAMNALAGGAGMGSSAKHGSRRAQDLSAPH